MYRVNTGEEALAGMIRLLQVSKGFEKAVDRRTRLAAGITYSGFMTLIVLHGLGETTAYRVSLVLGMEHHSAVEIINRLKVRGLVGRAKDGVYVTAAGQKAIKSTLDDRYIKETLAWITRADISKALKLMREALLDLVGGVSQDITLSLGKD
jgi:DNA-binding MarR family transcriptional regulator